MKMSNDYLPRQDSELEGWFANFLTVAGANLGKLGLVSNDLTALTADKTQFASDYSALVAAKLAVTSGAVAKATSRKAAIKAARVVVNKIQGNPTVTPDMKAKLRIADRSNGPTHTAPVTPDDLKVTGTTTGVNTLKWKPNGNGPGTQYCIEAQIGSNLNWTLIDAVTASRYAHKGQTPGVRANYRISARRNGKVSVPCDPIPIYGPPSS